MKFWRMTGLIAASPVDTILDKDTFTLEELLDEDETIQECRGRNGRLINFLQNRSQVEQLLRYIVEEAPEDADERLTFKFPFIACEIFICDIILNTLVEDEELMDALFSFLKPDHPHNTLLAGYFGKVVISLLLRKTARLMKYIQNHQEILRQLVDLLGITSIMEVLIWLIGANENMYTNYEEIQWIKDTDVLEMVVDKFRSSDSPEVHVNASEVLCAIIRNAPPGLASKICTSSFMRRLFCHALEGFRPNSVLVNALSVCITLLDPKRLVSATNNLFRSQLTQGSLIAANPDTIDGILESLVNLLKVLEVSSAPIFFPTTYGYLKPPFGKHRLKIVELISVLMTIGSESAERELVQQGAIQKVLNMFFEYPYNNLLHHQVENIIGLCLDSRNTLLIEHLLNDCHIVEKILETEKQPLLSDDCDKPTIAARGRSPPRRGNFGHLMCIANKLAQSANSNNVIHTHLQENKEWVDWHQNVLLKRNALENLSRWACGRPNVLLDQLRFNDDKEFEETDYDIVALANDFSEDLSNEENEETNVSPEQEEKDVSDKAEVISPLSTNSNQFSNDEDTADSNKAVKIDENFIDSSTSAPVSDLNTDIKKPENDHLDKDDEVLLNSDPAQKDHLINNDNTETDIKEESSESNCDESLPKYDPKLHEKTEIAEKLKDSTLEGCDELKLNLDHKLSEDHLTANSNIEGKIKEDANNSIIKNGDDLLPNNESFEPNIKGKLKDSDLQNDDDFLPDDELKSNEGLLNISENVEENSKEINEGSNSGFGDEGIQNYDLKSNDGHIISKNAAEGNTDAYLINSENTATNSEKCET